MVGHGRSDRNGTASRYCSQCGTGLEASANYCPNCGASTDRSTADPRRRTEADASTAARGERGAEAAAVSDATDRRRLEHRIARASREGWELEHDFGDHAVMVRRTFGSANEHLAVALVTVWFTMGIGNALWGAYRYFGDAERMVLRPGPVADERKATDTAPLRRWRATAGGWWLMAAVVALIGLEVATAMTSLVVFALAAVFAMLGTSALPSVRRRLESRHALTANGRIRSIDERTVTAPERSCAVCAEPVGRGLERTYREEFCVFGVPLTGSEGRNYYCRACANAETHGLEDRSATDSVATADRSAAPPQTDGESEREHA